jgi:hypothetical protein
MLKPTRLCKSDTQPQLSTQPRRILEQNADLLSQVKGTIYQTTTLTVPASPSRVSQLKGEEVSFPYDPKRHEERVRMLGVIVVTCMTFGCDSRRPSCTSSTAVCRLLCYVESHDEK